MSLDAIDGKIVYLIGRNARLSSTAIARALRLSRELVNFRLHRLYEQGILQGTALNINPNILGLIHVQLYLRIQCCPLERMRALEEFFRREKNIVLVLKVTGSWDYVLTVLHAGSSQLGRLADTITTKFPEVVDLEPMFIIKEQGPGWGMLVPEKEGLPQIPAERSAFTSYFSNAKPKEVVLLDDVERKLLTALGQNVRIGILELSKKVGISYRTARNKIARLISAGVISRFDSVASVSKLGFTQRTLLLKLKNISKNEGKANEIFTSLRNCSRYWRTFGMAHYRINIYARTTQEFAELIEKLRAGFGEDLVSLEGMENIAQVKRIGFSEYEKLIPELK